MRGNAQAERGAEIMVWLAGKKIFHHVFDVGFERVDIPIQVSFEFEVQDNFFVHNTLSKQILYNKEALERRYPKLKRHLMEEAIEKTVQQGIQSYLRELGCLSDN